MKNSNFEQQNSLAKLKLDLDINNKIFISNLLRDGANLEFICDIQIKQKNSFFSDDVLVDLNFDLYFKYDPLTREFLAYTQDQSFIYRQKKLSELLQQTLSKLAFPLSLPFNLKEVNQENQYYLKVVVILKHSEIPPWLSESILFWSEIVIPETEYIIPINPS